MSSLDRFYRFCGLIILKVSFEHDKNLSNSKLARVNPCHFVIVIAFYLLLLVVTYIAILTQI